MPLHAYVRTSMLIHVGSVISRIISAWEFGFSLAMIYALGYPTAMQINVVITASFRLLHKTPGNTGSEKKRTKLSMVNWKVRTLLPLTVNAYSTIINIGATIMAIAQIT